MVFLLAPTCRIVRHDAICLSVKIRLVRCELLQEENEKWVTWRELGVYREGLPCGLYFQIPVQHFSHFNSADELKPLISCKSEALDETCFSS